LVEEKYNGAAGLVEARIEVQWGTGRLLKPSGLLVQLCIGCVSEISSLRVRTGHGLRLG